MGYHVSIVRTGDGSAEINEEEIGALVAPQLGFTIQRDSAGRIEQVYKTVEGEEVVLFFDDHMLWAKNPTETALQAMIEVAGVLGRGARVRGDEGETYESEHKTYRHPDDQQRFDETPKVYWKDLASWVIPVCAGLVFLYALVRLALKYL